MAKLGDAFAFVIEPPSVPGIGTGGGLKGYVQDKSGRGLPALEGAAFIDGRRGQPDAGHRAGVHAVQHAHAANLRRHRPHQSRAARRADHRVFETLSVYMGSAFVNDFNMLGRTYRVTAQADNPVPA